MTSLFPPEDRLRAMETLQQIREFTTLPGASLAAIVVGTGPLQDSPRNLAILPQAIWRDAVAAARLGEGEEARPLPPVEAAQAGLLWRIARKVCFLAGGGDAASFVDIDPFAVQEQAPQAPGPRRPGGNELAVWETSSPRRKIKMATIADQADDTEIQMADGSQVTAWHQQYVTTMGAPPPWRRRSLPRTSWRPSIIE